MNQRGNQLYKTNEALLQNTFLSLLKTKEISQITIREICELAKVNRSTFYHHYEDIYALMKAIEHRIFTEFIEDFILEASASDTSIKNSSAQYISEEHLRRMIEHIHKHAVFYCAYLNSNRQPLLNSAQANLWEKYFVTLFQSYGVINERHMFYYFQFFKAGLIQCIKQWLDEGCPETPAELAYILWKYTMH